MIRYGYSSTGKRFILTDEMIELRDNLARGLGYVLRPCSMGGPTECWENLEMNGQYKGQPTSLYHAVRCHKLKDHHSYNWPERAEIAAWAIDRGKTAKVAKGEKDTPLLSTERQS